MDEKRSRYYYATKEERIAAWQENRAAYQEWRFSPAAETFINQRRKRQTNRCFICIGELGRSVHIDHIIPLYYGGTNARSNLCLTHPECNTQKGTQIYTTPREASRRRRQFKLMLKAKKAQQKLSQNRNAHLSKKEKQAVRLLSSLLPLAARQDLSSW